MTPGIDGATFDGMTLEKLDRLARNVAEGHYRPRPVRRVYIPKGNGKLRALGIPTADDRIVQEVVRTILSAIYEPVFSKHSHGFRAGRSCHTALEEIRHTWTGVKWLIEVDVRGFFDNIDHEILLMLLSRRIDDPLFVGLIEAMLKAGCMEDWKLERTYSGTPQGGVVSPLLANIYLHELDLFMEETRAGFDQGARRRSNPAYLSHSNRIAELRKKIDALRADGAESAEARALQARVKAIKKERLTVPSVDPMDPGFRRLRYSRYADDFLVGVIGSKADAVQIMADIQHFLAERLNLTVSPEKTGVRDASKGSPFLGFHVCAFTLRAAGSMAERPKPGGETRRVRRRPTRGNIKLWVPMDRVYALCRRKKLGNIDLRNGRARAQFLDSSDAEIIVAYNSELRGFANYYAIADGVKSSLDKLELVMFRSLLATMASRHRTTVKRTMRRLKMGADYGVTTMVRGEPRIHKLWRLKHLTVTTWQHAAVDNITVGSRLAQSPNDLISRLSASECEACGNGNGPFEVHHPNRLKDKRRGPMTPWKQAARRRRTVVLCRSCHVAFHGGRMPDGMESRVHRMVHARFGGRRRGVLVRGISRLPYRDRARSRWRSHRARSRIARGAGNAFPDRLNQVATARRVSLRAARPALRALLARPC